MWLIVRRSFNSFKVSLYYTFVLIAIITATQLNLFLAISFDSSLKTNVSQIDEAKPFVAVLAGVGCFFDLICLIYIIFLGRIMIIHSLNVRSRHGRQRAMSYRPDILNLNYLSNSTH